MKKLLFAFIVMICLLSPIPSSTLADRCSAPAFVAASAPPLVMFVMERDHRLYYEAYNDASDLDEDGMLDVGYKHSIDYFGYFDSYKCYTYVSTGTRRFVPARVTPNKYCGGAEEWSGNFLNWLSMSRMDVLRKVLYGGTRVTDSSSETVLEGVYIPQDAHSWGKEYAGADTRDLTPWDPPTSPNRHLFCMTSTSEGSPHLIRVARNDSHRIWEWASTERAVCGGPDTPAGYRQAPVATRGDILDYIVRVQVCNGSVGNEPNCKEYPGGGGVRKPTGLLQIYAEGDGTKVCSKTWKSCNTDSGCGATEGLCVDKTQMYLGLITGSYVKNLSGGVLRKNIWGVLDEINAQSGSFQSSENTQGNIILTLDRMKTVGFRYSDYSYQGTAGGTCGWITDRPINEGECRMWGNPIGEMMYEALRYFTEKTSPTGNFTYSTTQDAGLSLSKPSWGMPKGSSTLTLYNIFPSCAKGFLLVLSDVNNSYDSDQVPGAYSTFAASTFTGDFPGLDVTALLNDIGTRESIPGGNYFVGQSQSDFDFICSSKSVSNLSSIRGLCPEEPTKQGHFSPAAMAYYGKSFMTIQTGKPDVTTLAVAMSSAVPDIKVKVGDQSVRIAPVGKSVSGDYNVYTKCAANCTLVRDVNGLHISNCNANAYCPSNQIVDFYVEQITYDADKNLTNATFRVNFEDVEQGADHDMDAIVMYQVQPVGSNQVQVTVTSSYAAGSIDQVLGFTISGTSEDGLYLVVRDRDMCGSGTGTCSDANTPAAVGNLPLEWTKTFTVVGNPAGLLKNPLWYAAKYGGFSDSNGNRIPDLTPEWDKDGDGVPDNYFFVDNPLKLYEQMERAFIAILNRGGSAGAVATVTQQVEGEDIVMRGAFTSYELDPNHFVWKGHLESYWPYGGCSDYLTQSRCEELVGCKWQGSSCTGSLYSFQREERLGQFCFEHHDHCWTAEDHLPTPNNRTIYSMINGSQVAFTSANVCTASDWLNLAGDSLFSTTDCADLVSWVRGTDTWTKARDRDDWILGDIVFSTPVVVQSPSLAAVPSAAVGDCAQTAGHPCSGGCDCSSDCVETCYYCFRECNKTRKKVVYVGGNDGMLHAVVAGIWYSDPNPNVDGDGDGVKDESHWIYDPNAPNSECDGQVCTGKDQIGKELWAYIPSNILSELKELARPTYGTQGGCKHRFLVDLSPQAWEVYIDPDGNGRRWRTVLLGGERDGGDMLFAIDVTDPDQPKILWEYPILRNMVQITASGSDYLATLPFLDKTVYDQVKNLPASWSIPYVGKLKIPTNVSFLAANAIPSWTAGTPALTLSNRGPNDLSGWVAIIGDTSRVFNQAELPGTLTAAQKDAALKPHLLAIDIETGVNLFQYLWPMLHGALPAQWPKTVSGTNVVPHSMTSPVVLDLWDSTGHLNPDGYLDHIYLGDLNGNFYGMKFNLDEGTTLGMSMDVWKTKPVAATDVGSNNYRSSREPISVQPSTALDQDQNVRIYFGTGKFDNLEGTSNDKTDTAKMSFYNLVDSSQRPSITAASSVTKISDSPTRFTASGGIASGFKMYNFGIDINLHCSSPTYNASCTWVKSDGTQDCCESACASPANPCWDCIYGLNFPGERVVDSALVAGGLVFFTTFIPKSEPCSAGGDSYFYVLDYQCGSLTTNPFGQSNFVLRSSVQDLTNPGDYAAVTEGTKTVAYVAKLGPGMPSRPVLDSSGEYVFIQTSDAQIHKIKVELLFQPFELRGWKEEPQ